MDVYRSVMKHVDNTREIVLKVLEAEKKDTFS